MTLTNNVKFAVQPVLGETAEVALAEPGANEAEAQPVTIPAETVDWTYSATAEDNGAAGILDGEPGIIYNGPNGNFVRVSVKDFDTLEHAITPPEATDKAALALYVNSELFDISDEGFSAHASEVAVEHNIDTIVGPLNEGDVIRVAVAFSGEEADADLDISPGSIVLT